MFERARIHLESGPDALASPLLRYALLERAALSARRNDVELLAFGLGDGEARLVFNGEVEAIRNVLRGVKVGTVRSARAYGVDILWAPTRRDDVSPGRLVHAVAWAHRAPVDAGAVGPLASTWSSHRDLLGYRKAQFYDRAVLNGLVDVRKVHRLAGGEALPATARLPDRPRESLSLLLRLAAAVLGVLPADRRCFRLFVHLARRRGWRTIDLADALMVSCRRIRQLASTREPLLPVAIRSLADPRLCRVP